MTIRRRRRRKLLLLLIRNERNELVDLSDEDKYGSYKT